MKGNRLYHSAAAAIIKMIETENYSAGMRLPAERELASKLGVSRVVIREAEISLEARGVLDIKGGSGVYVCEQPVTNDFGLSKVNAFGLTQTRLLFEPECAALAATKISDDQISELEATVELMASVPSDSPEAHKADHAFHILIAKATGNDANVAVLENIWYVRNEIDAVRRVYKAVGENDSADRVKEHSDIMDALRDRDPEAARLATRQHFTRLLEALLDFSESEALEDVRQRAKSNRDLYLRSRRDA